MSHTIQHGMITSSDGSRLIAGAGVQLGRGTKRVKAVDGAQPSHGISWRPTAWIRPWMLVLIVVCALAPAVPSTGQEFAHVKHVYDGDTVLLEDGRRVRYLGINTPEFREPFYQKAKRFNQTLVLGRDVRLVLDQEGIDAHDRLLAYVYVGDQMVNAALVREGLAHAFFIGPSRKHNALLLRLQDEARKRRLGIWSVRGLPEELKITNVRLQDPANPDPQTPYVRVANLSPGTIRLAGYVLTNEGGRRFVFPDVAVDPGYTVLVSGTVGPDGVDGRGQLVVRWPDQASVWDPREDTAFLLDPSGALVDAFHYKGRRITRSPPSSRRKGSRGT